MEIQVRRQIADKLERLKNQFLADDSEAYSLEEIVEICVIFTDVIGDPDSYNLHKYPAIPDAWSATEKEWQRLKGETSPG